jgi:ADP-ribosyl-[dinitrogen reductase] hydrolase
MCVDRQKDRAVGSLLGLAIGDAVGTTLEFRERDSYVHIDDMIGGGPFDLIAGQWTDDTATALALAESLLAYPQFNEIDFLDRLVDWHDKGSYSCTGMCFDIGITTLAALQRYKENPTPYPGPIDDYSAGNGSLMRIAPVAIRHWNQESQISDISSRQSRTTHGATEALSICVIFSRILSNLIKGYSFVDALDVVSQESLFSDKSILRNARKSKNRQEIRSTGYVVDSFEAAIWCVSQTNNFKDAVLLAANLGGDADTVAAITGQLAGAKYGRSSIPAQWIKKLAWFNRLDHIASLLFEKSIF